MIVDAPGDADASRVGQPLQPDCNVDPVPVDVPPFLDHIPEIDPDPEGHPGPFRGLFVPPLQFVLYFHGALYRVHHAVEPGEKSVAVNRHYAAAVLLGEGAEELEIGFQRGEGPRFVLPHEAAVPFGARAQDRREFPLALFRFHRHRIPASGRKEKRNRRWSSKGYRWRRTDQSLSSRFPCCQGGAAIVSRMKKSSLFNESI